MKCILSVLLVGLLFVCGCSNKPELKVKYETRSISVTTEPEGARVYQLQMPSAFQTTDLGLTPFDDQPVMVITKVSKIKNYSYSTTESVVKSINYVKVRITKDGYHPFIGYLSTKSDEVVAHSIKLHPVEASSGKSGDTSGPSTVFQTITDQVSDIKEQVRQIGEQAHELRQ